MRRAKRIASLFLAVLCAGCCCQPCEFSDPTAPSCYVSPQVLGRGYGSVSYFAFLGCIPLGPTEYEEAVSAAVGNFEGGRALVNTRSWETVTFAGLGAVHTLHVEGDVVK